MSARALVLGAALAGCLAEPTSHGPGISYVKPFLQTPVNPAASYEVSLAAAAAGNAVVFHVSDGHFTPQDFTITATGWTITQLATHGSAASFAAIAPDAHPATFRFTSTGTDSIILADEFTGNDPSGTMTFFDHNEGDGGGDCVTTLLLGEPGDAVWAACTTYSGVAPGPGFGAGAATDGNAAEWAIPKDPAGTTETMRLTNMNVTPDPYVITAVTIRVR